MPSIIQQIDVAALKAGDQLPEYEKQAITKVQLVQYAGASGDFNPLHTDDAFAQSIGMNGVIAHGMLIMGFLGEYVMQLVGDRAFVSQFSMRFGAMTVPGDQITCSGTVESVVNGEATCSLRAVNQTGKTVGSGQVKFIKREELG